MPTTDLEMDLILANAEIKNLKAELEKADAGNMFTVPDDWVRVVRCKDCKYYKPPKQSAHWEHKVPYCCRVTTVKVTPDSFCSYGERKDGVNNG